jgi:hypothetical protein
LESRRLLTPPPAATASHLPVELALDAKKCKLLADSQEAVSMKTLKKFVVLSLLLAAPLLLRAQSNNTTTLDDVKQSSKDAATTAGHYTEQQIKELNKAAERQYHELGKKLNDLKADAQTQTGQARSDMDKKIADAQKKLDDLKPKLKELKTAATNAWGDVKSAFDNGIQDLEKTFQ